MQTSESAPNTYRGSPPRAHPAGGRMGSAVQVLEILRPRSSSVPSYRPNQRSGSASRARAASWMRARGRGRSEREIVLVAERGRVSNQSEGAARREAHDRARARGPRARGPRGLRSMRARPSMAPVRRRAHSPSSFRARGTWGLRRQESLHLEDPFSFQHEIDGAAELVGEDGEGFPLAMLSLEAPASALKLLALA